MSTTFLSNGMPQPPLTYDLTTTNATAILAGGDTNKTVTSIGVVNDSGSPATLLVEWSLDSANWNTIWREAVAANAVADMKGLALPIVLGKTYSLRATASAGNALHVTVIHTVQL